MKNSKKLMKEASREYQEDPRDWNFWISPASEPSEPDEVYITHRNEAYFLKVDSIYTPNPVGVGTKMQIEGDQFEKDLPEFGFRKFSRKETEKFFESMPKPEEFETEEEFKKEVKKHGKKFERKAMRKEPVPVEQLDSFHPLAAMGPYERGNPLSHISKKHEELDRKLSKELEELKEREYPGYG